MPTIIYPPSIPWNWMFQRPQQLLLHLSHLGYDVLYEDPGPCTAPQIKHVHDNFRLCRGVSATSLPHSRPRILWLTVPRQITLVQSYRPDVIVFDALDEPKDEFAGWAPYYPLILKTAHLILASGQSIFHSLAPRHPNVHLVPNGVDYRHFNQRQPRPADLPEQPVLIGYSGAIASWLDWELLNHAATDNPTYAFVFMGSLFKTKRFPLKRHNVHYLGHKPYAELPGYLQQLSLGLIPFRLTEMTKGCNPIKLYEYYAAGVPVLATPLPEVLSAAGIHVEGDREKFSKRLRRLVETTDSGLTERLTFAQENDWASRARQIDDLLT